MKLINILVGTLLFFALCANAKLTPEEAARLKYLNGLLASIDENGYPLQGGKLLFDLGRQYALGEGVVKDATSAAECFGQAAKAGYAPAQAALGEIYFKGIGLPQNYIFSYFWLNLAAAQGHQEAAKDKKAVAKLMSKEQIARAQLECSRYWNRR